MKCNKLVFWTLLTLAWTLQSCDQSRPPEEESVVEHSTEMEMEKIPVEDVEIITVDGCEYIIYKHSPRSNTGFGFMAHKGNCSNPIHIYRKPDTTTSALDTTTATTKTE